MTQISYNGLKFKPFISSVKIQERVKDIAAEISREYEGKVPLIICVLNGAFPFAADIFRNLTIDAEITFIRLKSYSGTSSTGAVKEIAGLSEDVAGRDVIVIEDIIDTGRTMVKLLADLKSKNPASLKVATLLHKPEVCKADIHPDYIGFNIPPAFIIGYGLDIDGLARNLQDIWVVDDNA
ncbi:MAG: hypoxanthine phosphoribosyltransferase [Paramuribaculum sp.]|nr:hypoxanthine phosphoribosyltransferase [Paramuribaculum sp.]